MGSCSSAAVANLVVSLHVEYGERRIQCGILFIFSLCCEYINLEYVRIHVIYRVNKAEYAIVAAPQEYGNTDSTRRVVRETESVLPSIYLCKHLNIDLHRHMYIYPWTHQFGERLGRGSASATPHISRYTILLLPIL